MLFKVNETLCSIPLRKAFYDDIGKQCSKRQQRLLAGVIDRALVRAFNEVAPEADHDGD